MMSGATLQQLLELAQQAIAAGQMDECVGALRQATMIAPRDAGILNALGVALQKSGQRDQAIETYHAAIQLEPQSAEARFNLALALRDAGQIDESITTLRSALDIQPNHPGAWNDLGTMLWAGNRQEQALKAFEQAASLHPDAADIQNNLGTALLHLGRFDDAGAALKRAIALQPSMATAHYTLAQILLMKGDFRNGWREYEWRFRVRSLEKIFDHFPQSAWDGGDLNGRRLLVHDEQGFGDTIQFVRYLPKLKQLGAGEVTLLCNPPLMGILRTMQSPVRLIARGQPLPPFDAHCSLMSLPMLLGTTPQTIPAGGAYLSADPASVNQWRGRIKPQGDSLKVGLVWSGRKTYRNDQTRSIPPDKLGPLGRVPGVRFFSLQKGEAAAFPDIELTDWTTELNDFTDTAGLIANLDLVISVDTAVAHLAAAMGKPVWLLLPYVPDWRWMLKRSDSPWYPTMRLFRQSTLGDWSSAINEIVGKLPDFASPPAR